MIDQKAKEAIEQRWLSRATAQGLKPGTKAYQKAEVEFFSGVMTALDVLFPNKNTENLSNAVPPLWIMNALSGRPIVGK